MRSRLGKTRGPDGTLQATFEAPVAPRVGLPIGPVLLTSPPLQKRPLPEAIERATAPANAPFSPFNLLCEARKVDGPGSVAGTGRSTFSNQERLYFRELVDRIGRYGASSAEAARLFALAGGGERDPVTSMSLARFLGPALERAIALAEGGTPVTLVKLEVPFNLKGANALLNGSGANALMRELAHWATADLKKAFRGGVKSFRAKGPGVWAICAGADLPAVERVLYRVAREVERELGLRKVLHDGKHVPLTEVPHPDHPLTFKGIGMSFGAVSVAPWVSPADALDQAELALQHRLELRGLPRRKVPPFQATLAGPCHIEAMGPRPKEAGPPPGGFSNDFEERKRLLLSFADERGVPRSEVDRLWNEVAGEHDPLTGALSGRGRLPTIERAIDLVRRQPGARAMAVLLDIGNLSGLTAVLGRAPADEVLKAVIGIVREEYAALGAKADFFRHGGDEFMVVLTGDERLTVGLVESAARRIEARVHRLRDRTPIRTYPRKAGCFLADIPHAKHAHERVYNGVNVYQTVLELHGLMTAVEVAQRTDAAIEDVKRKVSRG